MTAAPSAETKRSGWYTDRRGTRYAFVPLGGGKRKSVRLTTCATDDEAQRRTDLVREVAATLVAAGHADLIEVWATKATEGNEERARAVLANARKLAVGTEVVRTAHPKATGPTFRTVAESWTSGDLARQHPDHVATKRTADMDVSRLKVLNDLVGDVAIADFRVEHAEDAMRRLPERCRTSATRRAYAQVLSRVLSLAVYPLRVIAVSPLPKGFLPKTRQDRALQTLFPDEERDLLACTTVPLVYRMLYGYLSRTGARKSEAIGSEPDDEEPMTPLTWECFDLARGAVLIGRSKTEKPRPVALEPSVARALTKWRAMRRDEPATAPVFADETGTVVGVKQSAELFREHLKLARVARVELHTKTKDSLPVRVHDLRALFVTASLAEGKPETWIRDRTGHKTLSMLDRYRRQARMFEELNLGSLVPLDAGIPELGDAAPAPVGPPSDGGSNSPEVAGSDAANPREVLDASSEMPAEASLLIPLTKVRILPSEPDQRTSELDGPARRDRPRGEDGRVSVDGRRRGLVVLPDDAVDQRGSISAIFARSCSRRESAASIGRRPRQERVRSRGWAKVTMRGDRPKRALPNALGPAPAVGPDGHFFFAGGAGAGSPGDDAGGSIASRARHGLGTITQRSPMRARPSKAIPSS